MSINDLSNIKTAISHVGMIIHSTTLDTEAKVKAIYGGTTWIRHSDYVLRGASSGVVANSAQKTGGSDNAIIPYHRHSVAKVANGITGGSHTHRVYYDSDVMSSGSTWKSFPTTSSSAAMAATESATHSHDLPAHNTDYTGSSTTNANIPNYKSVYIWERTA